MRVNNNQWNRLRYTLYSPIYNVIARVFNPHRKKSIDSLNIEKGQNVLLIGAGSGLDLDFIPFGNEITAIDITPSMVQKIENRNKNLGHQLNTEVMDAQDLDFEKDTYDFIIMHLILAVVPDPKSAIKEAERVLKPNGEITVFDKFIPAGSKPKILRKWLNHITNFLFSDITRDVDEIIQETSLIKTEDEKAALNGQFRIIKLKKPSIL